tara:strand:+ start:1782 stop:2564 length:783 start_codon:yes stop_codon:yes gene_type:complete
MALTKIKAGSIADGAVTSAKLAAGAGGVGSEYISATPTLSSSVVNVIVIGNYSSYLSPVFITKIGSTIIPNTDNAGTLTLAAPSSIGGTQTVSVEAFDLGKLYSASATGSVELSGLTARYWRLTNQVNGGTGGGNVPIYSAWQLYPNLNGGGTKFGNSQTGVTASYNYSNNNVQNLYTGSSAIAWYLYNHPSTLASHWVQYDLGSAQEVLSMKWANHNSSTTGYYASSFTIQNSNDGTNWADVKVITQTAGGHTLRTINL